MKKPILEAIGIDVHLPRRTRLFAANSDPVRIIDQVDLSVRQGEILGLVGESGCGKTTIARTLLGIQRETRGSILLNGRDVSKLAPRQARFARRDVQYVHQDAAASLDPWWRIGGILEEGLIVHGEKDASERDQAIEEILQAVGLDNSTRQRYVHELSGGQLRRVALARILLLRPSIVILDEPTSGLDMSIQALVLKLLLDLKERFDLTYVFISHDLSVVQRLCDRVAIMYLGRIVEIGTAAEVFEHPVHPYTRALLTAAPRLVDTGTPSVSLVGDPPNVRNPPSGCSFHTRCTYALDGCARSRPALAAVEGGEHQVACLRAAELGTQIRPGSVPVRREMSPAP